jgi:hypothetical protein
MTISTALKALSGVTIGLAVAVAAVTTTGAPAEAAKPIVRDHRTTPKWRPNVSKKNFKDRPVVRDNRTAPTWQPKMTKPRWPHYPHKH